ncbi:hypothetical protein AYK61_12060 [Rhodococcus sp. SBT000017]|jgi:hypothetical protein|nr:hypothetical protein CH259_09590 [Rhodococcus sp. 05-2254-4]OZE45168.1 hypothetical protein CH261_14305 [Rhodococcus sp. 05-2254-3]OZE45296.1 hypothetical protein CH283_23220 [Rhodococcus sp. 05-2254-2]OZF42220.1 hypothetical protein CH292_25845 [Rhodococcus sp. 14-2470-1a]RMB77110.1 hypothetical protein AYK61_12060 [Rhodococcus sp. SBT000017]
MYERGSFGGEQPWQRHRTDDRYRLSANNSDTFTRLAVASTQLLTSIVFRAGQAEVPIRFGVIADAPVRRPG